MAVTAPPDVIDIEVGIDSSDPIFIANIRALAMRDPHLAKDVGVGAKESGEWSFAVEDSRTGDPTVIASCDNKSHSVHSRFDPVNEATDLVTAAKVKARRNTILFGLGLGYTLEAALEELPEYGQVLVIEPDLAMLRLALETRDLSQVIADPRVKILVRPTMGEAFQVWMGLFSLLNAGGVAMVPLPNIEQTAPGSIH